MCQGRQVWGTACEVNARVLNFKGFPDKATFCCSQFNKNIRLQNWCQRATSTERKSMRPEMQVHG